MSNQQGQPPWPPQSGQPPQPQRAVPPNTQYHPQQPNTPYPPQWQPRPPYPQQSYQQPPTYYPPQQYYQQVPAVLPPPPPKKPDRGREIAGLVVVGLILLCVIFGVISHPNTVAPTFNTICQNGNTSGDTEEYQGGNVYLDAQIDGAWTIEVQELQ